MVFLLSTVILQKFWDRSLLYWILMFLFSYFIPSSYPWTNAPFPFYLLSSREISRYHSLLIYKIIWSRHTSWFFHQTQGILIPIQSVYSVVLEWECHWSQAIYFFLVIYGLRILSQHLEFLPKCLLLLFCSTVDWNEEIVRKLNYLF